MKVDAAPTNKRTHMPHPETIIGFAAPASRRHRELAWPVLLCIALVSYSGLAYAQRADALEPQVRKYVRVGTPKVVLEHVQVIDGTGAPPRPDQNITIEGGTITALTAGADQAPSDGTTILDLRASSVMRGIVGMHDPLFFLGRPNLGSDGKSESPAMFLQMTSSAPRLYLANGVTTARTVGSIDAYTDVRLKQAIEAGQIPGPHLDVTGPYLEGGSDNRNLQMHLLTGPPGSHL